MKREVSHDDNRRDSTFNRRSLGNHQMLGFDFEPDSEIPLDSFDLLLPIRRADPLYPLRQGQVGIGTL